MVFFGSKNSLSRDSFFSFRQGPFVAMLIPKAHKIAVYSKLFNGEVSFRGCVSRCNHVQFFFSQLPSGFGLQYFSQTWLPLTRCFPGAAMLPWVLF
jgi:hypothetical protein